MFWLSRPQTCQCAYACTHRRAVGLGLEQGSFFPSSFPLKKLQQKNHNCPPQINTFVRTFPFHTASGLSEGHHPVVPPGNAAAFQSQQTAGLHLPPGLRGSRAPPGRDGKADFPRYSLPEPGSAGNGRFPTAATENNTEKAVCCCVKLAKSVKKKKRKKS